MNSKKTPARMGPDLLSSKGRAQPSPAPARGPEAPMGAAAPGHTRMQHDGRSFNISVRVDEQRYRELKKLGALHLTTNQAIMSQALDEYLDRHRDELGL